MSLSLVDFSIVAQGSVFHSSPLNGDTALCLIANKVYVLIVLASEQLISDGIF